jgi:hypothetical protein
LSPTLAERDAGRQFPSHCFDRSRSFAGNWSERFNSLPRAEARECRVLTLPRKETDMDLNPLDRRRTWRVLITMFVCLAISLCMSTMTHARLWFLKCVCAVDAKAETTESGSLEWHTNYADAYAKAKRDGRMLLVNFVPSGDNAAQRQLENAIEKDRSLERRLQSMVLVRVPRDYKSGAGGHDGPLVNHPAFAHLHGRTGIAIIDLKNSNAPYYGKVVTALPFSSGKYYRWRTSHLNVALGLPPGTITQRTMIWAVRIHPESPDSTAGHCHGALTEAAKKHSEYQARIGVQGHHRWESRFHQIRAQANAGEASEVVAESWPNQNMIDSCIDCVASWRHSPGHWGAVRGRHRLFGYDIRRGRNGIWYGTGIFAN